MSKYIVFSDEKDEVELVKFEFPDENERKSPTRGFQLKGVVYDHRITSDQMGATIGKPLSGNPQISDLVGEVLTIVEAMISDKEQREAFKSLMRQTLYGYANKKEREICEMYNWKKSVSNKSKAE